MYSCCDISLVWYELGMILSTIMHHSDSVVVLKIQRYPFSVRMDVYDLEYDRLVFKTKFEDQESVWCLRLLSSILMNGSSIITLLYKTGRRKKIGIEPWVSEHQGMIAQTFSLLDQWLGEYSYGLDYICNHIMTWPKGWRQCWPIWLGVSSSMGCPHCQSIL